MNMHAENGIRALALNLTQALWHTRKQAWLCSEGLVTAVIGIRRADLRAGSTLDHVERCDRNSESPPGLYPFPLRGSPGAVWSSLVGTLLLRLNLAVPNDLQGLILTPPFIGPSSH